MLNRLCQTLRNDGQSFCWIPRTRYRVRLIGVPTERPFPSVLGEPFEVTTTLCLGQAFFRCSSQRLNNASGLVPLGPRFLAGFETGGGREHLGCSPFPVSPWPFGQRDLGHPDLASVRRTLQSYDWN